MTSLRLTGLSSATSTLSVRRRQARFVRRSVSCGRRSMRRRKCGARDSRRSECLIGLVRNASMSFLNGDPIGDCADEGQHDERHLSETRSRLHRSHQHETVHVRHVDSRRTRRRKDAPVRRRAQSSPRRRASRRRRRMSQLASISSRMRRFVALSSTTRRRRPSSDAASRREAVGARRASIRTLR